jgi:hypothetical protein
MPTSAWNYREATGQACRLLHDLTRDPSVWKRFVDDAEATASAYGLQDPGRLLQTLNGSVKCPPASIFASELDWKGLDPCSSSDAHPPSSRLFAAYRSEILPVLSGVKPASRLGVRQEHLGRLVRALQARGLALVISPYKEAVIADRNKNGFANLASGRLPLNAPASGMVWVYVALDVARAQVALVLEALGADGALGRALGYPECCIEFFRDGFARARDTQGDLVPWSIRNTLQTPPFPFYLNNVARYFGFKLIQHFPCRYSCAASLGLGRQYLQAVEIESPDWAAETRARLLCPVVYSILEGVVLLEEVCISAAGQLTYAPHRLQATSTTTRLYRWLQASDRLEVHDPHSGGLSFYKGNTAVGQIDSGAWCLTFTDP